MRQAGIISDERDATRLADYLLTLGIETKLDRTTSGAVVWVLNEDHLPQAREELAAFVRDPTNARYGEAAVQAEVVRRETVRKDEAARRNIVEMRDMWGQIAARRRPLTVLLIAVSVIVSLGTNYGADRELVRYLTLTNLIIADGQTFLVTDLSDIRHGEIWRAFTPIFLHLDLFHLLFNMYALYVLGGLIEVRYGTWRYALLLIPLAALPLLGEHAAHKYLLHDSMGLLGGMSGVIFGLFGYAWVKSRLDPTSGIFMPQSTVVWMIAFFLLCVTGLLGNVANWWHGVGLALGVVMAYVPLAWRGR